MNVKSSLGSVHLTAAGFPITIAERLLCLSCSISAAHDSLADQRQAIVVELANLIQADAGFWSWGRGSPGSKTMSPVAIIDWGFTEKQRGIAIEWGLCADTDLTFWQPIMAQMGPNRRSTDLRQEIIPNVVWQTNPAMRQHLARGGWENWLHSVQYSDNDTWSNFFYLRNSGRPEFGHNDAAIVEVMLNGIPWLHSTAQESLPPPMLQGLTPRQRTVMLLLLNGLARKTIAWQLNISKDTVGDHVKSIYSHFGVSSASELAALFLRSR